MIEDAPNFDVILKAVPQSSGPNGSLESLLATLSIDLNLDLSLDIKTLPITLATSNRLSDLETLKSKLESEGCSVLVVQAKAQKTHGIIELDAELWEEPIRELNLTETEEIAPLTLDLRLSPGIEDAADEVKLLDTKKPEPQVHSDDFQQLWDLELEPAEVEKHLPASTIPQVITEDTPIESASTSSIVFEDSEETSLSSTPVDSEEGCESNKANERLEEGSQICFTEETNSIPHTSLQSLTSVTQLPEPPPPPPPPAPSQSQDNSSETVEVAAVPKICRRSRKRMSDSQQILVGIILGALVLIVSNYQFGIGTNETQEAVPVIGLSSTEEDKSEQTIVPDPVILSSTGTFEPLTFSLRIVLLDNLIKDLKINVIGPRSRELTKQELALGTRPAPWLQKASFDMSNVKLNHDGSFTSNGSVRFSIVDGEVKRVVGSGEVVGILSPDRRTLELKVSFQHGKLDPLEQRAFVIESQPSSGYEVKINRDLNFDLATNTEAIEKNTES